MLCTSLTPSASCLDAQTGSFSDDMIPTVGFNMRKVTKGNVSIKVRKHAQRSLACR